MSNPNSGFSIVETIVSMGILLILLGLGTPFFVHFYKRYQVDGERSLALTLLRRARTMSLNGENRKDHGLYIASSSYTLFEGTSFASRDTSKDEIFDRNDNIDITGSSEIIFKHLNSFSTSSSLHFDNSTKQSTIYVNTEGSIDWQ